MTFEYEGPVATRALVVHAEFRGRGRNVKRDGRSAESRLEEALGLAQAIELEITGGIIVPIVAANPSTLMGPGKAEEIHKIVEEQGAGLVIVNAQLTPVQQRNLEKAWECKVLDRTGLILEIFGRRAATREGTLQVELAHLQYQKSRLVRSWTHLERQRGGFGFLGGPGESQLEMDRRIIQDRISRIEKELESVKRTRALHRKGRARVPYPVVALVGYTNAGKSTLFNKLTNADVFAKDLLFATLDPTMREISLPQGRKIILSDTVGFISDLPTTLVAAFRATLEEVLEADVILHVRDISHMETTAQKADVDHVLTSLGLSEERRGAIIEVWNKADLLPEEDRAAAGQQAARQDAAVLVSAVSGFGLSDLLARIEDRLANAAEVFEIRLPTGEGAGLAWCYANTEVLARDDEEDGSVHLRLRADAASSGLLQAKFADQVRAAG